MNILITGATGFIGRSLIMRLLSAHPEHSAFAVARSKESMFEKERITWILSDLSGSFNTDGFPDKIDAIIHLAQSKNYKQFPDKALDIFAVNCDSTLKLLDYGKRIGIKNFIYASSGSVYQPKEGAYSENDTLAPPSFYGMTKYISEKLVQSYSAYFSTNVLRYFFPFGPGQQNMMIPNLINSVKEGRPIYLNNDTGMKFTPTYIDDVIDTTIGAVSSGGSNIVNIAGSEATDIRRISEIIGEITGKTPVFEHKDSAVTNYVVDNTKMRKLFNIKKTVPVKSGILKTING